MRIIKEMVKDYVKITGNKWTDFYAKLDEAMLVDTHSEGSDLWVIQREVKALGAKGINLSMIKGCKDSVKSEFDSEDRVKNGEYFTPEVWCVEGRKYLKKHIPEWGKIPLWDASCGSGNLMRSSDYPRELMYMSTLQESDITTIKNSSEYQGATVFLSDFVNGIDYDEGNTEFLDSLPVGLQDAIKEDKPLVFYMNPPYKIINSKDNELGLFMLATKQDADFSRAACDIYYQFLYRLMWWVYTFNLSNVYLGVFGPITMFTGVGLKDFNTEFQKHFNFLDGMIISSKEFAGTSVDYDMGVGFTVWKSRGGYLPNAQPMQIWLDSKELIEGTLTSGSKKLFDIPKVRLSEWVKDTEVNYYVQAPALTSHATFKGQKPMVMKSNISYKMYEHALFTMMSEDRLDNASDRTCLLSSSTSMQNLSITKDNFWRAVASYTFRSFYKANFLTSKCNASAPDVEAEGYQEWLYNSIPLFLFHYRNRTSSLRGVEYNDEVIDIRNHLFYLSANEVRLCCSDPVILDDLQSHPPVNDFILSVIDESKPYWSPLQTELFDYCVALTKASYAMRKTKEYRGCTQAWDAGFHQLRFALEYEEKVDKELYLLLTRCKQEVLEPALKFGFI